MIRTGAPIAIAFIAATLALGCAKGGTVNPMLPAVNGSLSVQQASAQSNRHLWGLWQVNISADRQSVEIIPARSGEMHLNVVHLLEVSPCTACLKIDNLKLVEPNVLEADLTLAHPYPGLLKYTGFDVRGVFISQGNFSFPVSGRKIAWGDSVPRMLNPDGYTTLFNPAEFPPAKPPALGYIQGKFATGGDLSATLNPFAAFRKDAPRRMFEAGGSETRTVLLYAPPGPVHFGYAVDACWQLVPHEIIDPLVDFPPDANCLEAYQVSVDIPYEVYSSWMSQNPVFVEIFDHQGIETISAVTIEAPDLFSGEIPLTLSTQTGEESWLFSGMITNETGADEGIHPLLVKVTDTESDQNLGAVSGWCLGEARVKQGWARTWGGDYVQPDSVAIDPSGNALVSGLFRGAIDFDPGSGVDIHEATYGNSDIFLSKYNSSGIFQWARTWGGDEMDEAFSVAIDDSGCAYVTGQFKGIVDFDPGTGVDIHTSNGDGNALLSKFDSSGNFLWAQTWGGTYEFGNSVSIDGLGNAYVAGYFFNEVDFDPGNGVENRLSNGAGDLYLSKFKPDGIFCWVQTWGGPDLDHGFSVAADDSGNSYVAGLFRDTADFDPGGGVDTHTSNGKTDACLSKFDSSGNFLWARTWGSSETDIARSVAVDASGSPYVTGYFEGTVDFDPEGGVDSHTSNGWFDAFLSMFSSSGHFVWGRTWGSNNREIAFSVSVDDFGNAYVAGLFSSDMVDFDPGSGVDNHAAVGWTDAFLSRLDSGGNLIWARTWGGTQETLPYSVAVDHSGNSYSGGNFAGTVDFDPGNGADNHTATGFNDAFLVKFLPDGYW